MLIDNINLFIEKLAGKRILALDVSKNRIGLAVSNSNLNLALPLTTIIRSKFIKDITSIITVYNNYSCGGIVIGYPINLDGTLTKNCQAIRSFTRLLLEYLKTPIFLENEQLSTFAIKDFYNSNKLKLKKPIDANAAAYFLQNFLERIPKK